MARLKHPLALGLLTTLLLPAADAPKPKVRAITAFITIDAKSYPAQIEETVKFLSEVRDAVKAAGYEVAASASPRSRSRNTRAGSATTRR